MGSIGPWWNHFDLLETEADPCTSGCRQLGSREVEDPCLKGRDMGHCASFGRHLVVVAFAGSLVKPYVPSQWYSAKLPEPFTWRGTRKVPSTVREGAQR